MKYLVLAIAVAALTLGACKHKKYGKAHHAAPTTHAVVYK